MQPPKPLFTATALREPPMCSKYVSRRELVKLLSCGTIAVPVIGSAHAQGVPNNMSKAAAWILGSSLSLAAILYAQDKDPDTSGVFTRAKKVADAIALEIK